MYLSTLQLRFRYALRDLATFCTFLLRPRRFRGDQNLWALKTLALLLRFCYALTALLPLWLRSNCAYATLQATELRSRRSRHALATFLPLSHYSLELYTIHTVSQTFKMPPRKRKAKSKSAGPEPTPDAVDSQAPRDPVDQGAPDLPLQELLAEGQAQPAEQQEGQDLVDSGGLAEAKKKKMLTALTPEQEEDMVEWLSEHPVLWNKKMKDYKDIQMKDVLWRDQAAKLDKDVSEIQLWYKSLRSRFGRLKKLPSGSGALECSERDKWILLRLEFLRPFIADVPKRTAVSVSQFLNLSCREHIWCRA